MGRREGRVLGCSVGWLVGRPIGEIEGCELVIRTKQQEVETVCYYFFKRSLPRGRYKNKSELTSVGLTVRQLAVGRAGQKALKSAGAMERE